MSSGPSKEVYDVLFEQRPTCHYCPAIGTTLDHVVPVSRGGTNWKVNLVPACKPCNQEKAANLPTCACRQCRWALKAWRKGQRLRPGFSRPKREDLPSASSSGAVGRLALLSPWVVRETPPAFA